MFSKGSITRYPQHGLQAQQETAILLPVHRNILVSIDHAACIALKICWRVIGYAGGASHIGLWKGERNA